MAPAGVLGGSVSSPSTCPFFAILTGRPLDAPKTFVDRERTNVSDSRRTSARCMISEQNDRRIQKGAPRRLRDGTRTLKGAFEDGHNTSAAEIRLWMYFYPTAA